jgi:hypothetical protein
MTMTILRLRRLKPEEHHSVSVMFALRAFKGCHLDQVVALRALSHNIKTAEEILDSRLHFTVKSFDTLVANVCANNQRHFAAIRTTVSFGSALPDNASIAALLAIITMFAGVKEFGNGSASRAFDSKRTDKNRLRARAFALDIIPKEVDCPLIASAANHERDGIIILIWLWVT